MGKFHIDGDWYLVPDDYSWNLCRRAKTPTKKMPWAEITYHRTPVDALTRYCEISRLSRAREGEDGTVKDLADMLAKENERLLAVLLPAYSEVCREDLEHEKNQEP